MKLSELEIDNSRNNSRNNNRKVCTVDVVPLLVALDLDVAKARPLAAASAHVARPLPEHRVPIRRKHS